jgi:glycosyltransferase involved in cell wall biosynthesis
MTPSSPSHSLRSLQLGKSWFGAATGGGLDRMFDGLMRHFPEAGVDAVGLVAGPPSVEGAPSTVRGLHDESSSVPARLRAFRRAVRLELTEAPVDVVAAHFALYAAPVLDLIGDHPFVVHFHGPWGLESDAEGEPWWKGRAKQMLESLVYRRAHHFVVLSAAFRDVLTNTYGLSPDRVSIVPGGVDTERFAPSSPRETARRRLDLPADRPIALTVRRLAQRMGLETLIDAWAKVHTRCPDALLLIAGKGALQPVLEAKIDDLGLTDHVRLLGFVPDENLPVLYRAANVSVLPTAALEGFGLTTIESLAAGTPVLVTPVGGLPEVVRDLSTSLILPDASSDSLADGLSGALLQPERLPTTSACRHFAEARYSWPVIAAQTRAVYESVAKNGARLRPKRTAI